MLVGAEPPDKKGATLSHFLGIREPVQDVIGGITGMDSSDARLVATEGTVGPFEGDIELAFEALADRECRSLLAELAVPRTAAELGELLTLPSSTLYRKLNKLVESGLVEEVEQAPTGGNPAHRYQRTVASVDVSLDEQELPKLWLRCR